MSSNNPTGIVWLASYPKSGNTWVRSFLNNLHAVIENGLDVEPQDINKMQRLTAWDIGAAQYQKFLDKPIDECSEAEIDGVRAKVQQAVAAQNSDVLLAKTHNALMMSNGHPAIDILVTAGAVYIVRNPLDVVVSFSHHIGLNNDNTIRVMSTLGYRPETPRKLLAKSMEAGARMSKVGLNPHILPCLPCATKTCTRTLKKPLEHWQRICGKTHPRKSCRRQ